MAERFSPTPDSWGQNPEQNERKKLKERFLQRIKSEGIKEGTRVFLKLFEEVPEYTEVTRERDGKHGYIYRGLSEQETGLAYEYEGVTYPEREYDVFVKLELRFRPDADTTKFQERDFRGLPRPPVKHFSIENIDIDSIEAA